MDTEYRLYHIAKLYYVDGFKQNEIAQMLNISTMLVSRMLRRAQQEKVVVIRVHAPGNLDVEAAGQLRAYYPYLKEAVVVATDGTGDVRGQMGKAAAQFVGDLIHDDCVIGISWGKTLQEMAMALSPTQARGVQVLQLSGGFLLESDYLMMPSNLVKLASDRLQCGANFLNAPMFVASDEMCQMLKQEPPIHHALSMSRRAQINIMGVSKLDTRSTMSKVAIINEQDIEELKAQGAIGDVMGEFIDAQGEFVDWSKRGRYIGANIAQLNPDAYNICVAGEIEKAEIVDLAIKKRYVNTVVISSELARAMMNLLKGRETESPGRKRR